MNGTSPQNSNTLYPSISSPGDPSNQATNTSTTEAPNPLYPTVPSHQEVGNSDHPNNIKDQRNEKWGTHVMGAPAVPTSHPDNKKAAMWGASSSEDRSAENFHHPYLQYSPVEKPTSPMESILKVFNSWSRKAENMANNIWHNLKTNSSVSEAAWGKMNLTAKAITEGGFESLYKQTFATHPSEKLKKTFASYLSTTAGPVAGTLYLSDVHAAFCSDRPLSFTAPSGQETWSYYKVIIPLIKIVAINPVVMRENPSEKYIQIVTIDGHDFWFMGFVNYEKASRHLTASISNYVATGFAVPPTME